MNGIDVRILEKITVVPEEPVYSDIHKILLDCLEMKNIF